MAQKHYTPFEVASGQVTGTLTDFTAVISVTDNRLKTRGNGGNVANANGYDIRPYSDSGLSTVLSFELVKYVASTGELIMWVKVPSIATGTTIYLGYGDSALNTDGSSTSAWDSSYLAVYHFGNGSLVLTDSTSNGHTLTNHSGTSMAGKVSGGADFQFGAYLDRSNWISHPTAMTISLWAKSRSYQQAYNALCNSENGTQLFNTYVKNNNRISAFVRVASGSLVSFDGGGSAVWSHNVWHHAAFTYDSSSGLNSYIDGAANQSAAANGNIQSGTTTLIIANNVVDHTQDFDCTADEVRISNVARSAAWLSAEYKNQDAPTTFWPIGTEVDLSAGGGGGAMYHYLQMMRQ